MVLADSECVQAHLIGVFDLFDEVAQMLRRIDRPAALVECRR